MALDRPSPLPPGPIAVRRMNLSTLMRLVHTRGPISRADLTRATGLNRSTVGVLLAELSDHGLVVAGEPATGRTVGRPSPMIHPTAALGALTVYPDADAVDVALVGLGGNVLYRTRRPVAAAPTPQQTVDLTAQLIAELPPEVSRLRLLGVGMAVPGLVRTADGFVHMAPHLPWRDVPIADLMRQGTGLPTWADNDATLGTVAEAIFGAGRRAETMVYLHGGSGGIGSGVRLAGTGAPGTIDGGAYLPELGHLMVNSDGRPCHCGASGCLETEVSFEQLRSALAREGHQVTEPGVLDAVLVGGAGGAEVQRQLGYLTTGIRNAVNAFAPDLVVLGGFLATMFDLVGDQLTRSVREQLMPPLAAVEIRRGALGSDRIHIGAAEVVFEPLLRDPLGARMSG